MIALDRMHIFTRVAERWMPDIMSKAKRLGQILVKPERARDAATDLRDLDTVGQTDAVMIAIGRHKDLRFVAQAAEGDRYWLPRGVRECGARCA